MKLSESPLKKHASIVYETLREHVLGMDPKADIVMRGWDTDITTVIQSKLNALGIAVVVTPMGLKPLEADISGSLQEARFSVLIEDNSLFRDKDQSGYLGWDAEDLAYILIGVLEGRQLPDQPKSEIIMEDYSIKMDSTKKFTEIKFKTLINLDEQNKYQESRRQRAGC